MISNNSVVCLILKFCFNNSFVESFIKPQGESYTYQGEIVNPENPLDTIQGGKFKGCKIRHVDLNR